MQTTRGGGRGHHQTSSGRGSYRGGGANGRGMRGSRGYNTNRGGFFGY